MSSVPPDHVRLDVPTWIIRGLIAGALVLAREQYSEVKQQLDSLRIQHVEQKLKQEELQHRFDELDRLIKRAPP